MYCEKFPLRKLRSLLAVFCSQESVPCVSGPTGLSCGSQIELVESVQEMGRSLSLAFSAESSLSISNSRAPMEISPDLEESILLSALGFAQCR